MKNNILIGIISVIVIALIGVGAYTMLNNSKGNTSGEIAEPEEQVKVGEDNENVNTADKKILITYFSVPETDKPHNMTQEEENSTHVVDGEVLGNTQYIAMLISEKTGGDLYRIEPKIPYTTNHKDLVDLAKEEQNKNVRPELKNRISNFDDYDIIYVGYPNWWSDMPQILYTFLELYNFEGKTVIPFNTHGGSGLSGTVNTIKNKLNKANVIENAFTISRTNMNQAPNEVDSWLKEINAIS